MPNSLLKSTPVFMEPKIKLCLQNTDVTLLKCFPHVSYILSLTIHSYNSEFLPPFLNMKTGTRLLYLSSLSSDTKQALKCSCMKYLSLFYNNYFLKQVYLPLLINLPSDSF